MAAKDVKFKENAPRAIDRGREHPGRCGQGDARPEGPQRSVLERSFGAPPPSPRTAWSVAKEIELKDKFENMGRAAGEGSRLQDFRCRRRDGNHPTRDGARPGDRRRRHEVRRRGP